MPVVDFCNLYKNQYKLIEALFNFFLKLLQYYWESFNKFGTLSIYVVNHCNFLS